MTPIFSILILQEFLGWDDSLSFPVPKYVSLVFSDLHSCYDKTLRSQ
ncbi:hypothetical protein LEP1GSC185_0156 [Leptospira licerasiae serovar Varillal str. VAR 010]|uniref:Uncharacterized protein n=1 Tax=Leptospira licerasiae str. MMD4847 TaxID=1049971 RepID=A0ABN0H4U1_9LEPT|nr:hypothetical protein LEP1GSC185_0156 [Leptospira licerasiae serovar Varillal str. VAR 010]EJZ40847.1 hypothetical protein LEP1GSC178_1989 [Leptospira licerasiae str. MMD4847]